MHNGSSVSRQVTEAKGPKNHLACHLHIYLSDSLLGNYGEDDGESDMQHIAIIRRDSGWSIDRFQRVLPMIDAGAMAIVCQMSETLLIRTTGIVLRIPCQNLVSLTT